jgi:hypothetical protein
VSALSFLKRGANCKEKAEDEDEGKDCSANERIFGRCETTVENGPYDQGSTHPSGRYEP